MGELQDLQDFPLNRVMAIQRLRDIPFNVHFNEEVLPGDLLFGGAPATLEGVGTGIAKLPLAVSFLFGSAWRFRVEAHENGPPKDFVANLLEDVKRFIRALDGMSDARLAELQTLDEQLLALLSR
jgi:hypothetical protein